MTFTSYAQNFEDVMLWRALQHVQNGCYIDVGAQHPVIDSVSKAFYDKGWRGIHVEPVLEFAHLLRENRPDETVLQVALGDAEGTLSLNVISGTGLSTGVERHAGNHHDVHGFVIEKMTVPMLTMRSAFRHLQGQDVHWLKIDVEGFEKQVLEGWDSATLRPWIMVIEATEPLSKKLDHQQWEHLLLQANYAFVYFDGLNRFYVANEHSELAQHFSAPPNVFDHARFSGENSSEWSRGIIERRDEALRQKDEFISQTQREAKEFQAAIDRLKKEVDAGKQQLIASIARADERERLLQTQVQAACNRGDALHAQLLAHQQSVSWRLTRPLRAAYAALPAGMRNQARRGLKALYWAATPWKLPARKRFIEERTRRLQATVATSGAAPTAAKTPPARSTLDTYVVGSSTPAVLPDHEGFIAPLPVGKRTVYLFVDHTVFCDTNTGVQRVVRGLASGLARTEERLRYVKWDPSSKQCVVISWEDREYLAHWNGPPVTPQEHELYLPAATASMPVPLHRLGANNWLVVPEVTHLTPHPAPVTLELIDWAHRAGLTTGFVFYDAIPLRRPELKDTVPRHREYMQHLRLADVVWPISEWSKADLLAYWAKSELATSNTIPEVTTLALPGESTLHERVKVSAPSEPLIISVGSVEPRKNQIALVRAFQAYRAKHPDSPWRLVLAGNLHPLVADEIHAAVQRDPAISYRGHVTDEELNALYGRCAFSVFPSVEEGFGLPILESLWFGKPCLCADFGAMAEVAKDGGCLTVNVRDAEALHAGLVKLIQDERFRQDLSDAAIARKITGWVDYTAQVRTRIDRQADGRDAVGTIYYWVDSTVSFPKNTGIQRVNRQLARGLLNLGFELVPVKWDSVGRAFYDASPDEKVHLAKWFGPEAAQWASSPDSIRSNSWFLMTELPLNLSTQEQRDVVAHAHAKGLKCAAVFYDAIPWKLRQDYPEYYSEHFSVAHHEYMGALADYELVLPISEFSRSDLIQFLGSTLERPRSLDTRIKAALLPGELIDRARNTTLPQRADSDVITVICVGTVEPRKNHLRLIEAFVSAQKRTKKKLKLIIAGRECIPELTSSIDRLIDANPNVSWEKHADDSRLQELYELADFTVYPSLEEGFGLPILESLWCGRPCICANFGAMSEVAHSGGCLTADVRDTGALADAILELCEKKTLDTLTREAIEIDFKSWHDYALEVSLLLAQLGSATIGKYSVMPPSELEIRSFELGLEARPKLSICISTYNRAEWLAKSLANWSAQYPRPVPGVELLVCDNASTDHTEEVVKPFLGRTDFSYRCNPVNVGMLGNLRETAHHARGDYVWIIGDDDLLMPGAIPRVLDTLVAHPEVALVYLNYSFTRLEDARTISDFESFFRDATPIVPAEPDLTGPIKTICARNENFFTAIYTLVLRRDHAINAYSQDTSGRPFSTMKTAIPTTHYVLNHMMDEAGVWIGTPQLVVNMNVSWMKYAPLWILERVPEFYDLAEEKGAAPSDVDRWRRHTLGSIEHFLREIYENDPLNNASFFQVSRLVWRFKHLQEFREIEPRLRAIYETAYVQGHPAAKLPPSSVFPQISFIH